MPNPDPRPGGPMPNPDPRVVGPVPGRGPAGVYPPGGPMPGGPMPGGAPGPGGRPATAAQERGLRFFNNLASALTRDYTLCFIACTFSYCVRVIDKSGSMSTKDGRRSRWEDAREAVCMLP